MAELLRLQQHATEKDKRQQGSLRDLQEQLDVANNEISQKSATLRRLEEENSKLRIDAGQYESKLESSISEISELHSAMASLHAEINVLQNENTDYAEKAESLTQKMEELNRKHETLASSYSNLQQEHTTLTSQLQSLQTATASQHEQASAIQHDMRHRIESLLSERDSMMSSLAKKDAKINQQATTNQELNTICNTLNRDLISYKKESTTMIENLTKQYHELQDQSKVQAEALVARQNEMEHMRQQLEQQATLHQQVQAEVQSMKNKYNGAVSDGKKYQKRIESLEREKHELFAELSQKSSDVSSLQRQIEQQYEIAASSNDEKSVLQNKISELQDAIAAKNNELRQMQAAVSAAMEQIDTYQRNLTEISRLKDIAVESHKETQKEYTAKIVDLSQKNARLSSENTKWTEELTTLRKVRDELTQHNGAISNSLEQYKSEHSHQARKIQELEDMLEEASAKFESCESELMEAQHLAKLNIESKEKEYNDLKRQHEREMHQLRLEHQQEVKEKTTQWQAQREQLESNHDKTLFRVKDNYHKQVEELTTARSKENRDYKTRMNTLLATMESLQAQLADESARNNSQQQELAVLRDLLDNGGEAQQQLQQMESERNKDKMRYEGQISELKEKIRQLQDMTANQEHSNNKLLQTLTVERDALSKIQTQHQHLEEECNTHKTAIASLQEELASTKKQYRDNDRKLNAIIQNKDDELQRLMRRNEVLSEAVTRLTQMNTTTPTNETFGFATTATGSTLPSSLFTNNCPSPPTSARDYHDAPSIRPPSPSLKYPNDKYRPPSPKSRTRIQSAPAVRRDSDGNNVQTVTSPSIRIGNRTHSAPAQPRDDDISASMLRVQQALEKRRAATPKRPSNLIMDTAPSTPVAAPHSPVEHDSGFAHRIREEVEIGKEVQLPYSPQPKQKASTPTAASMSEKSNGQKKNVSKAKKR